MLVISQEKWYICQRHSLEGLRTQESPVSCCHTSYQSGNEHLRWKRKKWLTVIELGRKQPNGVNWVKNQSLWLKKSFVLQNTPIVFSTQYVLSISPVYPIQIRILLTWYIASVFWKHSHFFIQHSKTWIAFGTFQSFGNREIWSRNEKRILSWSGNYYAFRFLFRTYIGQFDNSWLLLILPSQVNSLCQ